MNRGPEAGSGRARNADMRSFAEKAKDAWGEVPAWVGALAGLADIEGLAGAAKRVGYSASAVSQAIANKYAGDVERVAEKVGGALLGDEVDCPEPTLGRISRKTCLDWQQKPRAATSALRARMFHLCRGCPNFRGPRAIPSTDGGPDGGR